MNRTLAGTWAAAVVIAGGSAILAAPEQERPGQTTRAEVWIQNRNKTEAVPVTVAEIATVQIAGTPAIQISGMPIVAISSSSVVQARLVRQTWDYQTVRVLPGGDPASSLSTAGNQGWEATGHQWSDGSGTTILMKRPRQ